jgi:hypothetical protein
MSVAVSGGHLGCVKYLNVHGCPWNNNTLWVAARTGASLEVLTYVHEQLNRENWEEMEESD